MKITSRDITEILKTAWELGYLEFHLEHEGLVLRASSTARAVEAGISADGNYSNVALTTGHAQALGSAAQAEPMAPTLSREGLVPIIAPMSGIFYRSPSPGAPAFVNVGSTLKANDVLCLIEVMKLFSSIRAPSDGIVEEILVENEASVVAGQALMWLRPMKAEPSLRKPDETSAA
jgi:acetyl-CoA carboxylase biotin carboxyl carrier protein